MLGCMLRRPARGGGETRGERRAVEEWRERIKRGIGQKGSNRGAGGGGGGEGKGAAGGTGSSAAAGRRSRTAEVSDRNTRHPHRQVARYRAQRRKLRDGSRPGQASPSSLQSSPLPLPPLSFGHASQPPVRLPRLARVQCHPWRLQVVLERSAPSALEVAVRWGGSAAAAAPSTAAGESSGRRAGRVVPRRPPLSLLPACSPLRVLAGGGVLLPLSVLCFPSVCCLSVCCRFCRSLLWSLAAG